MEITIGKSAILTDKLRQAMVASTALAEVNETEIPLRTVQSLA